ncbi:hypothetical protein N7507_007796 [Penicillium longicatenatum]|nr:hypothetical protein N7507_007796 [Penicillium longicatenatum]
MEGSFVDIVHRHELPSLRDEDLVRLLYAQFGPQIDHLKRVPPAVESDEGHETPSLGNLTENALSPSRLLFENDYDEVNRSITNVRALKWVLANDYDSFVTHQPPPVRLSQKTFQELRRESDSFLEDTDLLLAMIVALVIGDMGKDPHLVAEIAERRGTEGVAEYENHDQLLADAVECGILDGPLGQLSVARRAEVILGVQIGATLNIPQLMQGENIPGSLQPVLKFRGRPEAFYLKYFETIFDVCGAGGHRDSCGAKRMIEPVCQSFLQAWPILKSIITEDTPLCEAYNQVLRNRGQLLVDHGFPELSTADRSERALLRLFAIGRVADRSVAEQFQEAFRGLAEQTRDALVDGMNVDGIDDGQAVLLYYIPALFAETNHVMRETSTEEQITALQCLMSFMARTYGGSRSHPGQEGSIRERDVSPAIKIVCDPSFRHNPHILDEYNLLEDS